MIRLAVNYGVRTVKLLHEQDPYHLVGESHPAKRYHRILAGIYLRAEAIGAAHNIYNILAPLHEFLKFPAQFDARALLSPLVQQYHDIVRTHGLKYQLPLLFLYLVLAKAGYVLKFGNFLDSETCIMRQAAAIYVNAVLYPALVCLSYGEKRYFHVANINSFQGFRQIFCYVCRV